MVLMERRRRGVFMMLQSKNLLLKNAVVYAEGQLIQNGVILIKDGKIEAIGSPSLDINMNEMVKEIVLPEQYKIIPGFIDLHIHGANGADTMDGTKEALGKIASSLPKEGTTSFLATTITQNQELIDKVLVNAGEYIYHSQMDGKAEILGIHLEGPFINPNKAGAQPIQHIIPPDMNLFEKWLESSKQNIVVVTLAPEQLGGMELVQFLMRKGIIASIGHSDATFTEVNQAIRAGATHITHLFNQMRGLHHREPGVVGAAFLQNELMVELIADGIHVSPEMVKLSYQQITSERLILITDAMRAKSLGEGEYELGGQKVFVKNGEALLSDGTLAGSVLTMGDAFKNIIKYTGCSIEDAIKMSATNPAKQIGVFDRKGSLKEGKDADLVILDENLEVYMTFCKGQLAYHKGVE
jgi:N-acetylglucosamine-6-phosphate deacetylase